MDAISNTEIANSVAKNTAVQMGQQIITWASTFLLMLFLPRYLGPVNYGRLYLAMSIAAIFGMVIEFDGRMGIAKRISRSQENSSQIVVNAIGFRILLWVFSIVCLIIFLSFADYPMAVKILILIFGLELSWLGARTVMWGLFLGFEKTQYSTIGNISERAFISLVGIIALLLWANTIVMAIIMIMGTLLNVVLCLRLARRFISSLPKFDWNASWLMMKEGIPYLLYAIFGLIYYRIDTIMLSFLVPEKVVGWYGASYKFFDVLAFLPSIYSLSVLPVLSRLWGKENTRLAQTTQKSLDFIMIAGIPISLCIFAFSNQIIKLFFGLQEYGPSVVNLQVFSVGLLIVYIDMVLGTTLFACDKQRQWAIVAFFAIILNVSLNLFFIPYCQLHVGNGGVGAAIATIVTEYFVMVCAIFLMPKGIFADGFPSVLAKALAAGIIMGGSIWVLRIVSMPWFLQLFVGIATYLIALLSLKTIEPEELTFVRNFLSFNNLRHMFLPQKKEAKV